MVEFDDTYSPRQMGILFQKIYGREAYVEFIWSQRNRACSSPIKSVGVFPIVRVIRPNNVTILADSKKHAPPPFAVVPNNSW